MRNPTFLSRAAAGVLAAGLVCAASPATAAPAPDAAAQVELVLDLSGSMKANDAGGQTRLAAAKQAVSRIVDSVPSAARVGVRVYGATYPGQDKAIGCADTQLLVPVAPLETAGAKEAAKRKIDGLDAVGFTPIGTALRAAADDLGASGPRRIVLVSDGDDTCAPPQPCEVAKELKARGLELAIDTVGFNVGGPARDQLKCIAQSTGGAYADANDTDTLGASLSTLVHQAWRPYDAVGTPVQGSTTGCADAPLLAPGQYLDAFTTGKTLYYRVQKRVDQDLQVSATAVFGDENAYLTHLFLKAGPPQSPQNWLLGEAVALSGNNIVTVGERTGTNNHAAADGDTGCLSVYHTDNDAPGRRIPLELLIGVGPRTGSSAPTPTAGSAKTATSSPVPGAVVNPVPVGAASHDDGGVDMPLTLSLAAVGVMLGTATGLYAASRKRNA